LLTPAASRGEIHHETVSVSLYGYGYHCRTDFRRAETFKVPLFEFLKWIKIIK